MRLTETQQAIRDTVAAFSRDRIAPNAIQWEADGRYPVELFTELAQLGLMGMTAPEAFGGTEADYVSYALALMEIAAGDGGLSTVISVHNAPAIACLLQSGSQAHYGR
jgi:alkylation response protein AidB-like acyl-CoA dehydrogenase